MIYQEFLQTKKKKRGFILTCTFGGAISLIRGIALYIWVSVYIHIYGPVQAKVPLLRPQM